MPHLLTHMAGILSAVRFRAESFAGNITTSWFMLRSVIAALLQWLSSPNSVSHVPSSSSVKISAACSPNGSVRPQLGRLTCMTRHLLEDSQKRAGRGRRGSCLALRLYGVHHLFRLCSNLFQRRVERHEVLHTRVEISIGRCPALHSSASKLSLVHSLYEETWGTESTHLRKQSNPS